jgi:hypothetical protein
MQLLIQYKNIIPIFRCLSKLPKNLWVIWTSFSMAKMFEMFSFCFPNVCVLKSDKNVESFASYCRVLMRSQTVWRWALLSCCWLSVGDGVNIDTRELNYTPISFICQQIQDYSIYWKEWTLFSHSDNRLTTICRM